MIVNKDVHDGTMVGNDDGTMVINSDDGTMVINDQETLRSGLGTMVINDDDEEEEEEEEEGTMKSKLIQDYQPQPFVYKRALSPLQGNTPSMINIVRKWCIVLGMGTTESRDEYRPSYMDHFEKMFESPQGTDKLNERKLSDNSNSQVVLRRSTESPFRPPKKFGPGDFDFVSDPFAVTCIVLNE